MKNRELEGVKFALTFSIVAVILVIFGLNKAGNSVLIVVVVFAISLGKNEVSPIVYRATLTRSLKPSIRWLFDWK